MPALLVGGTLLVVTVLAVALRGLPALLPYAGQGALDGLRFSLVVEDSLGQPLQVLPLQDGLRRIFVPWDELPPELVQLVVAAEDQRYWWHPGVDPGAVVRAWGQNAAAGQTVSGASTISMQVARLLLPRARTGANKVAEAWEALQLESRLDKRSVLELYLALVPFGRNAEGFAAASQVYFGRELNDLSRLELATLAVIPRGPEKYNPLAHPEENRRVAEALLAQAFPGDLSPGSRADSAPVAVLDPARPGVWPFRAPHYLRWLAAQPEVAANSGRQPLRTAIEPALQNALEQLVAQTVAAARPKRISNAAAFFLRPATGNIAAWVGSADFTSEADQGQVDGVTMLRQPGSTLKPFLYALALEKGATAASVLADVPTDFGGAEVYTPANFNDQFNGPVRLRQALASSLNLPAVQTLERLGVQPFTDFLIRAGFASLEPQRGKLGLGLALGNAEISLFELVNAYRLFFPATAGLHDGDELLDARVAHLVRDILTRHPDRVLAFGREGNARLPFEGALKTGTSNQFNNLWAVGFTSDLLGGVWMGNFAGNTVVGTADSGFPAALLARTLEQFSSKKPFPPLEGFERHAVCALSGLAATEVCPYALDEWFLPGTKPRSCDWHAADGQVHYPQEYQPWLAKYRYQKSGGFLDAAPQIRRPQDGAVFFLDATLPRSGQDLVLEAVGTGPAVVTLDGQVVARGEFPLRLWLPLEKGSHSLSVGGATGDTANVQYEVR